MSGHPTYDIEERHLTSPNNASCYITRRQRGIWLAHCMEDRDGTEEWDAFPTLAEAKRWGRAYLTEFNAAALRWEEFAPDRWTASIEWTSDE
jgi:hypothetical protein